MIVYSPAVVQRANIWQVMWRDSLSDIDQNASFDVCATVHIIYLVSLSQQMLTAIKYVTYEKFCFQQDSTLTHHPCNTVKLQKSELSASLLLIMAFNLMTQQWSLLIMRFRDAHISMNISCKLSRWKKSSSDWLKSHEVGYSIRVKRCNFCIFLFHKGVQRHYLDEVGK